MKPPTNQVLDSKLVVLTGGPCAGKSTVLQHLQKVYGTRAGYISETATDLLSAGFPPLATAQDANAWKRDFQEAMMMAQFQREEKALLDARKLKQKIVFCDRGLADAIAYHPEGLAGTLVTQVAHLLGWQSLSDIYQRYSSVICLESVALHHPKLFGTANNTTRYENIDEAIALDQGTREAWTHHPHFSFVCNLTKDLDGVCSAVEETVGELLQRKE